MKPRWLLLAVSVICLMALFPAAALSQAARIEAGCGSATIDGRVGSVEWGNAAQLPLLEYVGIGAAQGPLRVEEVTTSQEQLGTAYFMNDEQYLYVGAILPDPEDRVPDNAAYYDMFMVFAFEDEPAGNRAAWVDCAWRAPSCDTPADEGWLYGAARELPNVSDQYLSFTPWAAPHEMCAGGMAVPGSNFDAAPRADAAHFEMRVDLDSSQLNNPDPANGDCFDLRWILTYHMGQDVAGASGYVEAGWPADPVDDDPYTGDCSVLCLNPCEEEEFVPEPGTLMLLGGGLLSLAGYAGLRWRARE